MTRFEIAQLILQSTGMTAVILTLYVYYRQLRTMDQQRRTLEREMAARMRPWVGMFGFGLDAATSLERSRADTLTLLLRNCGSLPAQGVTVSLVLQTVQRENSIHWKETGVKALMPGEDGNYRD